MKWFVGVDGGGTKTAFVASQSDGQPAAALQRAGCSYQMIGLDAAVELVATGVLECLVSAGAGAEDCAGCCIGMPCYGESPQDDQQLVQALQAALAPIPIHVVNDVEVAYAGALDCREGIHLVAGTGSIAFGRGPDKQTARCGGWIEFFGDEGSCYWVGRAAMSLFSKEADGRIPRGALYDLVRQELGLVDDYSFAQRVLQEIAPHRERVAQFQVYAHRAAEQGDAAAIALYDTAAGELALMAETLLHQLRLPPQGTNVSYSGGLFKSGAFVLKPLGSRIEQMGGILCAPRHTPVEGALMLAIEQFLN